MLSYTVDFMELYTVQLFFIHSIKTRYHSMQLLFYVLLAKSAQNSRNYKIMFFMA